MSEDETDGPLSAFRHHRHDVVNFLQVMRAYTQLGKVEQALESLDLLAEWLKSLSVLQNSITSENANLVWHAATCPHVLLGSAPNLSLGPERTELMEIWSWLNASAEELGVRAFYIEIVETALCTSSNADAAYILSARPTQPMVKGWQAVMEKTMPQGLSYRFEILLQGSN